LRGVEFQILACTLEEQRRLVARILAAKKSGWAAVPFWGRGSALAAPATGDRSPCERKRLAMGEG
jgi:hypothetical protein